jgi:hypothetical protein
MPWPMTLPPQIKLLDMKTIQKNLNKETKINRYDLGGHEICMDSITIKKAQDFVRVGERGIEFTAPTYLFLINRFLGFLLALP